jgi:hypothetical protein
MGNIFAASCDIIREQNYSFAGGVMNTSGGIAAGITVALGGYFKDTLGITAVMTGAAALTVLTAAALLFATWRRVARQARLAPSASV